VEKDKGESLKWYLKAAKLGHRHSMYCVGMMLKEADEKSVDGGRWLKKAGRLGHGPACFALGAMYYEGGGEEVNDGEALKWLERGYNVGDSMSMVLLGVLYEEGHGVEKDLKRAKELYLKSLECNPDNSDGHKQLGGMLEREGNFMESVKHYMLALGDADFDERKETIERVKKIMLSEENLLKILGGLVKCERECELVKGMLGECRESNKRLVAELLYRPGGEGYEGARKDFLLLVDERKS